MSPLESNITYVPSDIVVTRLLKVADIADIAASLSPQPLFFSAPVTGRNFVASESEISRSLMILKEAYETSASLRLVPGRNDPEQEADAIVGWLAMR